MVWIFCKVNIIQLLLFSLLSHVNTFSSSAVSVLIYMEGISIKIHEAYII